MAPVVQDLLGGELLMADVRNAAGVGMADRRPARGARGRGLRPLWR
jgi:hypothetical protein